MNAPAINNEPILHISAVEAAKLIRKRLRDAFSAKFPETKFSVRSDYNSINIRWEDGPIQAEVDDIADDYKGGGFDGMIDMAYHNYHWMLPDGSFVFASTSGTAGSKGTVESVSNEKPHPDAKKVSFSASYVFTNRDYSPAFTRAIEEFIADGHAKEGRFKDETFHVNAQRRILVNGKLEYIKSEQDIRDEQWDAEWKATEAARAEEEARIAQGHREWEAEQKINPTGTFAPQISLDFDSAEPAAAETAPIEKPAPKSIDFPRCEFGICPFCGAETMTGIDGTEQCNVTGCGWSFEQEVKYAMLFLHRKNAN